MKYTFHNSFIQNNEILFYIFIFVIILIIIYAAYFTFKEIKKNENK